MRLGERDPEFGGLVDARELPPHPFADSFAALRGERIGRAIGTIPLTVDAHLGDEPGPLQPRDRVVERAVRDRHEPIVPALTHEPHHLVGVHVALAEKREHHQPQRGQAIDSVLHDEPFHRGVVDRMVHDV